MIRFLKTFSCIFFISIASGCELNIDNLSQKAKNFSSKKIAANLYKALNFAKEKFDILSIDEIEKNIKDNLSYYKEIELEYFVIADEKNLKPIKHKQDEKCRAFIAAYVSGVRLIDNVKLY